MARHHPPRSSEFGGSASAADAARGGVRAARLTRGGGRAARHRAVARAAGQLARRSVAREPAATLRTVERRAARAGDLTAATRTGEGAGAGLTHEVAVRAVAAARLGAALRAHALRACLARVAARVARAAAARARDEEGGDETENDTKMDRVQAITSATGFRSFHARDAVPEMPPSADRPATPVTRGGR